MGVKSSGRDDAEDVRRGHDSEVEKLVHIPVQPRTPGRPRLPSQNFARLLPPRLGTMDKAMEAKHMLQYLQLRANIALSARDVQRAPAPIVEPCARNGGNKRYQGSRTVTPARYPTYEKRVTRLGIRIAKSDKRKREKGLKQISLSFQMEKASSPSLQSERHWVSKIAFAIFLVFFALTLAYGLVCFKAAC